jgi:hypothetical protein
LQSPPPGIVVDVVLQSWPHTLPATQQTSESPPQAIGWSSGQGLVQFPWPQTLPAVQQYPPQATG